MTNTELLALRPGMKVYCLDEDGDVEYVKVTEVQSDSNSPRVVCWSSEGGEYYLHTDDIFRTYDAAQAVHAENQWKSAIGLIAAARERLGDACRSGGIRPQSNPLYQKLCGLLEADSARERLLLEPPFSSRVKR